MKDQLKVIKMNYEEEWLLYNNRVGFMDIVVDNNCIDIWIYDDSSTIQYCFSSDRMYIKTPLGIFRVVDEDINKFLDELSEILYNSSLITIGERIYPE